MLDGFPPPPVHKNETSASRAILKHLLQSPSLGYTLEELAEWWLLTEKVTEAAGEVKEALRTLCQKKLVAVRYEPQSNKRLYMVNPGRVRPENQSRK